MGVALFYLYVRGSCGRRQTVVAAPVALLVASGIKHL
jgi:hypothetical protein